MNTPEATDSSTPEKEVLAPTFMADGLVTWHASDFLTDPLFCTAWEMGSATGSWGNAKNHWRAWVRCWAARRALQLPGDFVECGVNLGGGALMIYHYTGFETSGKTLYLLDTFRGLPVEQMLEKEKELGLEERYGYYPDSWEAVNALFAGKPDVRLIRGKVPDTLTQVNAPQVAYLHLDMNMAFPEVAALRFFWPRLVPGACVVMDDYSFMGHDVQRMALNDFAHSVGQQILALPTGQGLLFRP